MDGAPAVEPMDAFSDDKGSARPGTLFSRFSSYVLSLFLLAVLANVEYCAAYVADIFVQFSGLDAAWRRGRAGLLIVGTAFAATITHFFAQGIF
jgi:hypothetical protein